jgi:hypothetical protein
VVITPLIHFLNNFPWRCSNCHAQKTIKFSIKLSSWDISVFCLCSLSKETWAYRHVISLTYWRLVQISQHCFCNVTFIL